MADTKKTDYGIVYLLTNPFMPGIVKIGMTSKNDLQQRMKELYTTGVPVPFECQYACKVKLSHMAKLESALHDTFAPQRINANREFFQILPAQAMAILKFIDLYTLGDATVEVKEEIDKDMTSDDKIAVDKAKKKRPSLNFYEMGLHDGDKLVFTEDSTTVAVITSAKKISFGNEHDTSLTAVTTKLLGKSYSVQPTKWWTHDGINLSDIYNDTYPMPEEE